MMKRVVLSIIILVLFSACTQKEEATPILPELTVRDVGVLEDEGIASLNFTLNLASESEVSIAYRVEGGTAQSGVDFIAAPLRGRLVFPAGVKTQSLSIQIINDTARRPTREFRVILDDPKGLTSPRSYVTVTITDDDLRPLVEVLTPAQVVTKAKSLASIEVGLSTPAPERIDLPYFVSGTGIFDLDHRFLSGVLTFPAGTSRATITGEILGNQVAGPNKTIYITLGSESAVVVGSRNFHTVIISDNNSTLVAALSGVPTKISNAKDLDVVVSGVGATSYKYKIATTYTCDSDSNYSSARPLSEKITDSISALPDGPVYLCVVAGNGEGIYQSPRNATVVTWVKNTDPPAAPVFKAILSPSRALGAGQALSNQSRLVISVGGLRPNSSVALYNSSSCTPQSEIGRTQVNDATSTVEGLLPTDGTHAIYAISFDQFSQGSSCTLMMSLYQLDTQPPRVVDVSTLESGGYYGLGSRLTIRVRFSKTLEVLGPANQKPYLTLSTQPAIASATYNATLGDTLEFLYFPKKTENSLKFDYYSQSALVSSASTIKDLAGNLANLELPVPGSALSISGKSLIYIDTDPPQQISGISDGSWGPVSITPRIAWVKSSDVGGSGIKWYEVAIGSAPGANDVVDWTSTINTYIQIPHTFTIGKTYYSTVRARDNAGNASLPTLSNGWGIDPDPPSSFTVSISPTSTFDNFTSPTVEWMSSQDAISGIDHYEVALGTTKGAIDVVNWQSVSSTTRFHIFNYIGEYGRYYFPSVRAVDGAGNVTLVSHATGWLNKKPVTTPNPALSFTSITLVSPDSLQISNEVTVQGIESSVFVTITGSQDGRTPTFSVNGTAFIESGTVKSGDKLRVRARAPQTYNDKVTFSISVGSGSYTWEISSWGCPTNYSLVKSIESGKKDFCVAKYETTTQSGKAVPNQGATPTVYPSMLDAVTTCKANGTLYDLISNTEYQDLARDLERENWNWEFGFMGSGRLSGGNIDQDKSTGILPAGVDEEPCSGIENPDECSLTKWSLYRRVMKLYSGDYVWDLSGNLREWVSTILDRAGYATVNSEAEKCESPPSPRQFDEQGNPLPALPTLPPICRIQISELTTSAYRLAFGPLNNYAGLYRNTCSDARFNTPDTCAQNGGTWSPGTYSWGGIGVIPKLTTNTGLSWISRGSDYKESEFASNSTNIKLWRGGIFSAHFQGTNSSQTTGAAARCVYRMP